MSNLPEYASPGTRVNINSAGGSGDRSGETPEDAFRNPRSAASRGQLPPQLGSEDARKAASAAAAAAAAAVASVHNTDPSLHEQSIAHTRHAHAHEPAGSDTAADPEGAEDPSGAPHHPGFTRDTAKKAYDCHICGWRFALKGNLVAHIRRHTGEKPYTCSICQRKFTQSSLLTVHIRTHTGEKPFKCTKCGRSFSRSGNLTTHMRTHSDTKPFECAFCHKTFSQRVNMELHTRIHTGVKPYRCGVCNRAFTSCSNMRRHWRHIHPSYPEPAMGTLHLLHGLPEKSLYGGPNLRGSDFRGSADPAGQYSENQNGSAVEGRGEMAPLMRSAEAEPVYSHIMATEAPHGMGNMPNAMVNPIASHQIMSEHIGAMDQHIANPLGHTLPQGMGAQLIDTQVSTQIAHHNSQLPVVVDGSNSHGSHQVLQTHALHPDAASRISQHAVANNHFPSHAQQRQLPGQYPIDGMNAQQFPSEAVDVPGGQGKAQHAALENAGEYEGGLKQGERAAAAAAATVHP